MCGCKKEKYLDDHAKTKDVHLFLRTSQQFHFVGHNPFMIIGTFCDSQFLQYELLKANSRKMQKVVFQQCS